MFGTFTRWYSQCIKDESRYHLGFDRKGPHVDDPHLYFNLSHSIELGRKERFDVTSGYFPTFPLGRNSLALEKLARPYLWLTAKGDIAAQRDIYISPFTPYFSPIGGPSRKGKKRWWISRIILHFFSKSIKTYRLRCSSILVEFSWNATDCIFVFFLFSFLSFDTQNFCPRRSSSLR